MLAKEVTFNVQVDYIIKSVEIPNVVTDYFIKQHTGYSTLAKYKQYIKEDLKQQAKLKAEKTNREKSYWSFTAAYKSKKYPKEELEEIENALIEKTTQMLLFKC